MVEPKTRQAARGRLRARCQAYTSMRRVIERAASASKNWFSLRCDWSLTPRARVSSQRGARAKPMSNRLKGAEARRLTAGLGRPAHSCRSSTSSGGARRSRPRAARAASNPRHSALSSASGAGSTPCDGSQCRPSSRARGALWLVMAFLPIRGRYLAPRPLESHLQIWEIFPKFWDGQNYKKSRESMRISDDRYSRDRLRLDLALRFIHLEARTHTIRAWTGLTDDRIRKLYRTYLLEADGRGVARHRGKSPRQAAYFMRSVRMRRDSAVFASVSSLFGLITRDSIMVARAAQPAPNVSRGTLLCEAFETYQALVG